MLVKHRSSVLSHIPPHGEAVHTSLDAMAHPKVFTLTLELIGPGMGKQLFTEANGFLFQLQSSNIVSFHILLQVMTLLKELTLKLQMQAIDVIYAYCAVISVASTFKAL